jgi:hypothetical protein
MITNQTVMKTNLSISLIFISGLAAFAMGASPAAVFAVIIAAGIMGLACHDYVADRRRVRFGPAV